MIKVGVIREGKNPPDMRVPLTPKQCVEVAKRFSDLDLKVQASSVRAFKDSSYSDLGTSVVAEVSDADVLIGVKEVPLEMLIPPVPIKHKSALNSEIEDTTSRPTVTCADLWIFPPIKIISIEGCSVNCKAIGRL